MPTPTASARIPWKFTVAVGLAVTGVAISGVTYIQSHAERVLFHQRQELEAIVSLKIAQISSWRSERLGDVAETVENPLLALALLHLIDEPATPLDANLQTWATAMVRAYGYEGFFIVDSAGAVRFSHGGPFLDSSAVQWALRVAAEGKVTMSDVRLSTADGEPFVDVAGPIRRSPNDPPAGVLILRSNPRTYLFPLIQSSPGGSPTAETLLIRQEGETVLYLNDLRHQGGTAMRLRLPLNETLPGAFAPVAQDRFMRGMDYRGHDVLAAIGRVPNTGWHLVAKVDAKEVLAPARRDGLLALLGCAACLLAAIGWTSAMWRKSQAEALQDHLDAQLARRDLESRLGAIADQAMDIILVLDDDLRMIEVNRRAIEVWGFSREELIGRKAVDLAVPGSGVTDETVRRRLERGDQSFETIHVRKDGTTLPVEINARPMMLEGKRVYQAIIRDISERKRAELALRASEERLATTLSSIGDAVIATDNEGRVERMNPVAEALTGWSLAETRGKPLETVFRIIAEGTRVRVESPVDRVLREGTVAGLANHTLLVARDGRERPIKDSGAPIRDPDGKITGVVLVFRDATEERATEETLSYHAHLLANISDAVIAADSQQRLTAWNHAAARIFGYSAQEVLGRPAGEVLVVHDSPLEFLIAVSKPEQRDESLTMFRRDGSTISVQGRCAELRDDEGLLTGYVAVVRDISTLLDMQSRLRLADRLTSLGTLAAGVAHEINNPLTAVMGNLVYAIEELSRPQGPRAMAEALVALREAEEGAGRVRRIVCDLKMFSRGDEEKVGPVGVIAVLESAISMTRNEIRHRAELLTDFSEVPDAMANESRLAQVFINLLVNAAQAIPEGHATHNRIRVSLKLADTGRVAIAVQDTGAGIPPDIRERIFDPFFTTKSIGEGTGLGLAICHGIVTGFGGEIRVESSVGEGTRFTVLLPTADGRAPAPLAPASLRASRKVGALLVIDDEPSVALVVKRLFAGRHEVKGALTAREGLGLIAANDFDLVLCDLMMPEMTGIEFYEELEHVAPDLRARTIFITGGAFTARAQEFLDAVDNPWLEKPFDPRALRSIVERMLG